MNRNNNLFRQKTNPLFKLGRQFNEFDKSIEDLLHGFGLSSFKGISENPYIPPINLIEKEGEYTLSMEIPGMTKDDIEITISEDNALVLKGEKTCKEEAKEGEEYYYSEISYGSFRREIPLPQNANTEAIKASYDKGVLSISLPKKEKEKPKVKKIAID